MLLDVDMSHHNEVSDLHWEVNRLNERICYRTCSFNTAFTQLFILLSSTLTSFIFYTLFSSYVYSYFSYVFLWLTHAYYVVPPLRSLYLSFLSIVTWQQDITFGRPYLSYTGGGIYSGGSGYSGTGLTSSVTWSLLKFLSSSQISRSASTSSIGIKHPVNSTGVISLTNSSGVISTGGRGGFTQWVNWGFFERF